MSIQARVAAVTLAGALLQGACGKVEAEPDATSGGATSAGRGVTSGGASGGRMSTGGTSGGTPATGGGETGTGGASTDTCAGIALGAAGGPSMCAETDEWTLPSSRTTYLFVMMDRSSSMLNAVPGSNPPSVRWQGVSAGVALFVADERVKETRVALGFFGASALGADDAIDCDVANYATPKVDFTRLGSSGSSFPDAMVDNQPAGLTPTLPALTGAIQHAAEWRTDPARDVSVVLVTDGYPTQCQDPLSIVPIANVARSGYDDLHVRTFVIGLAAGFNLNAMAEAGKTGPAILLDEKNPGATLKDALTNIATTRAPCEFPLNVAAERPEAAWLRFTPQNGAEVDIPNVGSAADCERAPDGGFYFDYPPLADPPIPTVMKACPCTCDRLKTPGTVKVIVGRGC